MTTTKIAIVGTGYVGLSTAVVLAEKNFAVTCVDRREDIVQRILRKECPIHEIGIPEALQSVSLAATTDVFSAVSTADVVFLCVGTPTRSDSDGADFSYLEGAAREIGEVLKDGRRYQTIVVKSTVPPGTTDTLVRNILESTSGRVVGEENNDFGLAMVPEFLREGAALQDSRFPGRVVLGVESKRAEVALRRIFEVFDVPIIATNSRTAELAKYMTNALLATLISFGNDFSNLAGILGDVDMAKALEALSHDPRWWPERAIQRTTPEILSYLVPGPGFGGSCFPKDLRAILSEAKKRGYPLSVPRAALALNEAQGHSVARTLERIFPAGLRGKCFGIYGLSFKPGTDDVRETPAARIIASLLEKGAGIRAYDPVAIPNYQVSFPAHHNIQFTTCCSDLFSQADGVIIATPWPESLSLFYERDSYGSMRFPLVYDTRGRLDRSRLSEAGCVYVSPLHPFPDLSKP